MGQPTPGRARARFGPEVRVTDMAPAYRASGYPHPVRTPAEQARYEQRGADLERQMKSMAREQTAAARRARDAEIRRAAEQYEVPRVQRQPLTRTPARSAARSAAGTAKRPPSSMPGSRESSAARQGARATARKGSNPAMQATPKGVIARDGKRRNQWNAAT